MPNQTDTALDPTVVNLAKAIRQSESGGNFNIPKGKSGEIGAYQFTPDTWKGAAPKYGINVPIEQATPEQQNAVAYNRIKEWKDSGKDVTQIASMWNAGEGEPDAYTGKFSNGKPSVGVNKFGANYDVPTYAESVAKAYLTLKNGGQAGPDANNPSSIANPQNQPEQGFDPLQGAKEFFPGVGQDLGNRLKDASQSISSGLQGAVKGDAGQAGSGALQTAGQVVGGIGDVINRGLEVIPGVKQLTGEVGGLIAKGMNTETGKALTKDWTDFAQNNPEAAKNIGAVANIASVIPMFKSIGMAVDAGKIAVGKTMSSSLEKAAIEEMSTAAGTSQAAKNLVGKGAAETLTQKGLLPDVVSDATGKRVYSAIKADELANNMEGGLEQKLQEMIQSKADNPISTRQARDNAIKAARDTMGYDPALPRTEVQIRNIFDEWNKRFGDQKTLSEMTDMKRDVRNGVKFDMPSHEKDAAFYVGQGLMKSVEDTAASRGISGVRDVNAEMGKIIQARKFLSKLDGKTPKITKTGKWHKEIAADVLGGVGEAAGNIAGLPFAGAMAGRGISGLLRKAPQGAVSRLAQAKGKFPSLSRGLQKGVTAEVLHNKSGQQAR